MQQGGSKLMPAAKKNEGITDVDISIRELNRALALQGPAEQTLNLSGEKLRRLEEEVKRARQEHQTHQKSYSELTRKVEGLNVRVHEATRSSEGLLRYCSHHLDETRYEELYKGLVKGYHALKDALPGGEWFILHKSRAKVSQVNVTGKGSRNHNITAHSRVIAVLAENPVRIMRLTDEEGRMGFDARVYFQPDGFILSRGDDEIPDDIVEFIAKPAGKEFRTDGEGDIYWSVSPEVLTRLVPLGFGGVGYAKSGLRDLGGLDIYAGDEKASLEGVQIHPRSAHTAYEADRQKYLQAQRSQHSQQPTRIEHPVKQSTRMHKQR
jgi:hypothetical protein